MWKITGPLTILTSSFWPEKTQCPRFKWTLSTLFCLYITLIYPHYKEQTPWRCTSEVQVCIPKKHWAPWLGVSNCICWSWCPSLQEKKSLDHRNPTSHLTALYFSQLFQQYPTYRPLLNWFSYSQAIHRWSFQIKWCGIYFLDKQQLLYTF